MIKKFSLSKFAWGLCLVYVGIVLPGYLKVDTFKINEMVYSAIVAENSSLVIVAALNLVILNTLRALPHYFGAFLIGESLEFSGESQPFSVPKVMAVITIIPSVYYLIRLINGVRYDFGIPAIVIIVILLFLGGTKYNAVSIPKKFLLITFFLMAAQFLDVMPLISFLPLGRGEMSKDVKLAARFLRAEFTLDFISMVFIAILFMIGILFFLLIQDELRLAQLNALKEQNEKIEMESKIRGLENRTNMEMKHLVHDLKSPLTAAQMLVGVVRESCVKNNMPKETECLDKTETSIEKLSEMISEILYDDYKSEVYIKDIVYGLLSQISISDYFSYLETNNETQDTATIYVNRIRFIRVLVNLIENAYHACSNSNPKIQLKIYSQDENVVFSVIDNGKGIEKEQLQTIWNTGYSTRNSHGLGLDFVKSVVEASYGSITVESQPDIGTQMKIILPKG